MARIITAEKPSVGRTYAEILGATNQGDGYIEGNGWIVTWSFGHLIEMLYPEAYDESMKKWSMDTLPFMPEKYKYGVIKSAAKQYKVVKELYNGKTFPDIEAIYYAGDSGREGLYIQMLIRMLAGHKPGIDERVVWIDSQTEAEVKRGIREAKPVSDYKLQTDAGFMRAIEDFLIGINFSRAFSLKYGSLIQTDTSYRAFAVGRVMTAVLGMVVEREIAIRNFIPTEFYRVVSQITVNGVPVEAEWRITEQSKFYNSPAIYNNNGFLKEDDAKSFIASLGPTVTIKNVELKEEKKSAPLLFNLSELQAECTKRFHLSPDQTLDVAQSLYEKKLTTYPRTSARVLTTAMAVEIENNLQGLGRIDDFTKTINYILEKGTYKGLEKTKYVDDSKVTDHYAIIPTGEGSISQLTQTEIAIYDLICKRFLSIFLPPAIYKKVSIEKSVGTETFFAGGKMLASKGYMSVYGCPEEKEEKLERLQAMAILKTGQTYDAAYNTANGVTTPPKRYTSGSLVLAMENAGNLIEEEELREQIKTTGIGTEATRAETISKLISNGYIKCNKKTQIVEPEDIGFMIYEVVKVTVPSLLSPKMTASWEKGLTGIEDGSVSYLEYRKKMEQYVESTIEKLKAEDHTEEAKAALKALGVELKVAPKRGETTEFKCPVCGGALKTSKFGYICENWKKDDPSACQFGIGMFSGKKIPDAEIKKLLAGKPTGKISGFKKKAGGTYSAKLILKDDYKIGFYDEKGKR